jgi:cell division cycle 20-like protein 1 (cofactor of APC complex)
MASNETQVSVPTKERMAEEAHTPTLISPPESKTPPTATHKRNQADFAQDRNSEPVDPLALSKALEQFGQPPRVRDRPIASPSRKRQRVYGDR